MPFPATPNMGLILPIVGIELGPEWAQELNNALLRVDSHDHTTGNGVPLDVASITVNADLSLSSFSMINVKSIGFEGLAVTLPTTSQRFVYVSGNELYYNDASNHVVQLTLNGGIAGAPGDITNLAPPAALIYNPAPNPDIFEFKENSVTNVYARLDAGSIIIRATGSNPPGVELFPPSAISANYNLALPVVPSVLSLMTLATNGAMGTTTFDAAAASMTSAGADVLAAKMTSVGADSIATSMSTAGANTIATKITSPGADSIAINMSNTGANAVASKITAIGADSIATSMSATGANTIANARTRTSGATVGAGGVAISAAITFSTASNSFVFVPGMSVTITTTGRPVVIMLIGASGTAHSMIGQNSGTLLFQISRGATTIATFEYNATGSTNVLPPGAVSTIEVIGAGTYTYFTMLAGVGGNLCSLTNCKLMAYEL